MLKKIFFIKNSSHRSLRLGSPLATEGGVLIYGGEGEGGRWRFPAADRRAKVVEVVGV
jgi:hypothetical protein